MYAMAVAVSSNSGPSSLQEFKKAVNGVLEQKHFQLATDRCKKMQQFGRQIVTSCETPELEATMLQFTDGIGNELDTILKSCDKYKLLSSKRQKAWSLFHAFRCEKLITTWKDLLTKLSISDMSSLLMQSVTQELFETRMKAYFHHSLEGVNLDASNEVITVDESNILVYACGYVPSHLIKRYKKRQGSKYASFVQCLLHMGIGECEESFYEYAKMWFVKINRGGAFEVDDSTYEFFLELEKKVRVYLRNAKSSGSIPESAVDDTINDEGILLHWSVIASIDLTEEESMELLRDVVQLWFNIRGFSITGLWNEQYKRITNESSKSKPGLRKGLKKSEQSKQTVSGPSSTS